MPMVRAMRLLNSIEAGSTSGTQLQQYLSNGGIYSDFSSICQLPGQSNVLCGSSTGLSAVNSSALATTIFSTSYPSNVALANSLTGLALAKSTYRTLMGACIGAIPSVWVPLFTFSSAGTTALRSAPASQKYTGIAYGNGIFMSVGNTNQPYYSTDGANWTATAGTLGARTDAANIAFGTIGGTNYWVTVHGGFAANTTAFYYSTNNGASWTLGAMPTTSQWVNIAFLGGRFVAMAGGSSAKTETAYSTNGTTWTAGGATTSARWISLAVGDIGGTTWWVAVAGFSAASTVSAYSSDGGVTWTSMSGIPNSTWQWVAYGNNRFVAVAGATNRGSGGGTSQSQTAYSTNGFTWTTGGTQPTIQQWAVVAYVNGYFVSLCSQNATTVSQSYSLDGTGWSQPTNPDNTRANTQATCIASSGTLAVCTGDNVANTYAIKNPTWGWCPYGNVTHQVASNVTYGNGTWIGMFGGGYVRSTDALTWTAVWDPFLISNQVGLLSSDGNSGWRFITNINSKWYGLQSVGNSVTNGNVITSTDFITWTSVSTGTSSWSNITSSGNNILISAGGVNNPISTGITANVVSISTDNGVSFTSSTMGAATNGGWSAPTTDGTRWIIGKNDGVIWFTNNLTASPSWTGTSSLSGSVINGVAYGNGVYVACTNTGTWWCATVNGSWTSVTPGGSNNYYSIIFTLGYFWVQNYTTGVVFYSTNGQAWTSITPTGTTNNPFSLATGNNIIFSLNRNNNVLGTVNI